MKFNSLQTLRILFLLTSLTGVTITGCSSSKPALYQTWYSGSSKACITINPNGNSFVNELDNVRFKLKGNRLRLVEVYNPWQVFGGRDKYWFEIDSLSANALILTQDLKRNRYYEQLADSVMEFTRTTVETCGHNR